MTTISCGNTFHDMVFFDKDTTNTMIFLGLESYFRPTLETGCGDTGVVVDLADGVARVPLLRRAAAVDWSAMVLVQHTLHIKA